MIALINKFRGWLRVWACITMTILGGLVFLMEFLIYAEAGLSPMIWTGKCSVGAADNNSPYAICQIDGKEVRESIKLKLFADVIINHKELICNADSFKNLYCRIE